MPIVLLGQSVGEVWLLLGLAAAIWVIYDVLKYRKKWTSERKIIWIVCALLFSIITAIVYYLVIKKK